VVECGASKEENEEEAQDAVRKWDEHGGVLSTGLLRR
jgi:hypothetical protein